MRSISELVEKVIIISKIEQDSYQIISLEKLVLGEWVSNRMEISIGMHENEHIVSYQVLRTGIEYNKNNNILSFDILGSKAECSIM